ncbi:MAG: ATP-binding protein [Candidatus Cryosericum sp.]
MTSDVAEGLYGEVRTLVDDARMVRKDRVVRLRQVLEDVLQEAVRGDAACTFADIFQRSVYAMQRDGVSPRIQRRVHALREAANHSAHELAFVPTEAQERRGIGAVCELIAALSGVPVPVALQAYCGMDEEALEESQQAAGLIQAVRALVLDAGEPSQGTGASGRTLWYRAVRCVLDEPDEGAETTLLLTGAWAHTAVWPFAAISATSCIRSTDGRISTTSASLVAVQPDILVEATTLGACFTPGRGLPNAKLALVGRYRARVVRWQILAGVIANSLFDSLAAGMEVDVPAFVEAQLRTQGMALLALSENDVDMIRRSVLGHVGTIRRAAERVQAGGTPSMEVSLASSTYGLQGRLDALVTGRDARSFSVVELKNGAVPHAAPGQQDDGTTVRPDQAAQVWCYELLVQSALGAPPKAADVVYLADEVHPWRAAASSEQERVRLLQTRNELVALDHAIAFEGDMSVFRNLTRNGFGPAGTFDGEVVSTLAAALDGATEAERAYFLAFSAFLTRERWTADLGTADDNGHGGGFARLWLMDLPQKEERLAVLPYLHIAGRDKVSGIVRLMQRPVRQGGTSFREGDGIILYRHDGPHARPMRGALFKGTITAIDHGLGEVTVQLYDRHAALDLAASWALELDASGGLITSQYAGLLHFLQVSPARRALLMGVEAPRSLDPAMLDIRPTRELTPHQRRLLGQALAAQDYFLMQGPPGSGKTQVMMVEMVRHLVHQSDQAVLLLAYTNRAVGEMCHALSADADPALHGYLVFGRDAGLDEQTQENTFTFYVEEHGAAEGRTLAAKSRVFVATVAMCIQHPEILQELKRHRVRVTAIVDEAAQLLEPQVIGILADVDRAILIGDERQLPAVVQQPAQLAAVTDPVLLAAGFRDLRMSLFERLLLRCKEQGWTNAVGMLTDQARMHQAIVAFPDCEFYGGQLHPLYAWQSSSEPAFVPDALDPLECLLATRRILFVPSSEQDGVSHVHEQEARRVSLLLQAFVAAYRRQDPTFDPAASIGVITPFRAQAACIYRVLPADLQGIAVDTVERYQGGERDIIIVSFAVHSMSQMPSIMAPSWDGSVDRKLNVLLTRARKHLVLLGDPHVLEGSRLEDGSPSHHARLLQYLHDQGAWLEDL